MRIKCRQQRSKTGRFRRATAAVEAAIVMPVLIFTTLGAVDIAQFINLAQSVSNASREAARMASRDSTVSVDQIDTLTKSYFCETFPTLSETECDIATSIVVRDGDDNLITGSNLNSITSGNPVSVTVEFDFAAVRWLNAFDYRPGANICTTVARRQ